MITSFCILLIQTYLGLLKRVTIEITDENPLINTPHFAHGYLLM
jgi:hypothetical protein